MGRSDEVTTGRWLGVPNMTALLESRGAVAGQVALGRTSLLSHIDWTLGAADDHEPSGSRNE